MGKDLIEEIKRKVSIEGCLEEFGVETKRRLKPYFILCPFHEERTPSFYVNIKNDTGYCFACLKGGDIFSITALFLNRGFKEALSYWKEQLGLGIEDSNQDIKTVRKDLEKKTLSQFVRTLESRLSTIYRYEKNDFELMAPYLDYIYEVFDSLTKENLTQKEYVKKLFKWYLWANAILLSLEGKRRDYKELKLSSYKENPPPFKKI